MSAAEQFTALCKKNSSSFCDVPFQLKVGIDIDSKAVPYLTVLRTVRCGVRYGGVPFSSVYGTSGSSSTEYDTAQVFSAFSTSTDRSTAVLYRIATRSILYVREYGTRAVNTVQSMVRGGGSTVRLPDADP